VHAVDLPFPRALPDCYGPTGTGLIAAMREQIRTVRE
jgi:hypothetical protein